MPFRSKLKLRSFCIRIMSISLRCCLLASYGEIGTTKKEREKKMGTKGDEKVSKKGVETNRICKNELTQKLLDLVQ